MSDPETASIDCLLHSHPKVVRAGLEAMGLWVLALSHCRAYATDGFVSLETVVRLAGNVPRDVPGTHSESAGHGEMLAKRLVDAKLWELANGGWMFHDFLDHQLSAKAIKLRKKKAADRKAKWRENVPRDKTGTRRGQDGDVPVPSLAGATRARRSPPPDPDPESFPFLNPESEIVSNPKRERGSGARVAARAAGAAPLPFSVGEMLRVLGDESAGKIVTDPFDRALAAPLTAVIRSITEAGCTLDDVRAAGRWIGSGGLAWMGPNDPPGLKWLAKAGNLSDAIGKARARPNGQRKRVPSADELEAERTGKTVGSNPFANWSPKP